MIPRKTTFILMILLSGALVQGQSGKLLYDMGLMIEDTVQVEHDLQNEPGETGVMTQEQIELEEELNRYQQRLIETEIRLKYQTQIIDSLQSEIGQIKAANETDRALLSTRITTLVDQQEKKAPAQVFSPGQPFMSDSVFAELDTPWKTVTVSSRPSLRVQTEPKLTTPEERAAYRKGLTKFHQEYYYQAIDEFNTIVYRGTDLTLQANAQYWVGRCYYEKGLYDEAIRALEQVQRYPFSDKLDDALVMIGLAFKNKDRLPEAKLAFRELVSRHPGSEYLTLAKRFARE